MTSSREGGAEHDASAVSERRGHRRMEIRLPIECQREKTADRSVVRTITQNISTGGLYLELDSPDFRVGDRLRVCLTIPSAEGVSPYPGRAACTAEVVRVHTLNKQGTGGFHGYGVAARFLDKLRISY